MINAQLAIRLLLALTLFLVTIEVTVAAAVEPLLMEGKKTLFQRVVTKPGTTIAAKVGGSDAEKPVVPFSIFYVYSRKQLGGKTWLQIAGNIRGDELGWVRDDQVIPWNQGLTVTFRNPLDRERALFFKDKDSLKKLVDKQDKKSYENLYKKAVAGKTAKNSPVIAIQPDYYVDVTKQFYLAPILQHEDVFFGDGQAKLLKIATIPDSPDLKAAEVNVVTAETQVKPPNDTQGQKTGFNAGVVFVMDSTLSMGPYINRTRDAIRKIYQDIAKSGGTGRMRFGLVAFRDNTDAAEGLGYLTKTYATLEQGINAEQFFSVVDQVRPATVSSKDFREDAFAGIKAALDSIDWTNIDARYVILVTDAGPRNADDNLGDTRLSASALNKLAVKQNISMTVLHLLTPQGANNHADAKAQYKTLSDFPGIGALYYGVAAGNVKQFGDAVDTLSEQISQHVQVAMAGKTLDSNLDENKKSSQLSQLKEKFSRIGNAMRTQYLSKDESAVPNVVSAWILDHSFSAPGEKTLDVGVLLTRNQLSDLHERLTRTLKSFEEGLLQPGNFIADIKSVAAALSRTPEQLKNASSGADLASMGLMQEYIEDLPYQSAALSVSLDDWETWPVSRQAYFVNQLEEKIAYYQALYDHTDMWYSPGGGAVNGDSMMALSLDMLP